LSRYRIQPLEFTGLKTVPLQERGGKVKVEHFAQPYAGRGGVLALLNSMPRLLAADVLRAVLEAIFEARSRRKPIVWGLGGHVIKTGLAPVLADLMDRGFATAFAMNGSAAIHDFEIALAGHTSEDVEAALPDGRFGVAEETGRELNNAIAAGNRLALGAGEALGRFLDAMYSTTSDGARPEPAIVVRYPDKSLLWRAFQAQVPVTVHIAIGTDTPHVHPRVDPAALGMSSHRDFRLFCALVRELDEGGVYLNVGSAVVLPEVFLKALSAVRNLGYRVENFTTVNLDFLQHYRPRVNVLERPHVRGGQGLSLTGHHEIMIPVLAACLTELDEPNAG
jgi:hypothetical protein